MAGPSVGLNAGAAAGVPCARRKKPRPEDEALRRPHGGVAVNPQRGSTGRCSRVRPRRYWSYCWSLLSCDFLNTTPIARLSPHPSLQINRIAGAYL